MKGMWCSWACWTRDRMYVAVLRTIAPIPAFGYSFAQCNSWLQLRQAVSHRTGWKAYRRSNICNTSHSTRSVCAYHMCTISAKFSSAPLTRAALGKLRTTKTEKYVAENFATHRYAATSLIPSLPRLRPAWIACFMGHMHTCVESLQHSGMQGHGE